MLSRAGRRQYAIRRLYRPYEQLALPWLCPALQQHQYRSNRVQLAATSTATSTTSPIPSTAHGSTRIVSRPSTRPFATATAEQHDPSSIYIPFEGHEDYSRAEPSRWQSQFPFSGPGDTDHSSLIILNDNVVSRPKALRRHKGIGGDIEEMLANLDVSLAVGMFDRAALLVQRLSTQYPHGSPEILNLHNKYIQMMVSHMIINRRSHMVFQVLRWFEVDMKMSGVKPDATTYGLLLKMSLRMLNGTKRQRTVDRYWKLVCQAELEEAVVRVPVLSEADLGLLSELCLSRLPTDEHGSMQHDEFDPFEELKVKDDLSDPALDVLSTEQKGFGLSSLKSTLGAFKESPHLLLPADFKGTREERRAELARLRQLRLEEESIATAIDRWRKESELRGSAGVTQGSDKKLGAMLHEWHEELAAKIQHELELATLAETKDKRTSEDSDRLEYSPFLRALGPEKLAGLAIISSLDTMAKVGMDKGSTLAQFVMNLGSSVEEEYMAERFRLSTLAKHEDGHQREAAIRKLLDKNFSAPGGKVRFRKLVRKFKQNEQPVAWSPPLKVKIGSLLASMLFNSTTVTVKQAHSESGEVTMAKEPAFRHVHQLERGFQVGYVHLHEKIVKKLGREPPGDIMAKYLPMVAPPRPWEDHNVGGFLGTPMSVIRVKNGDESQLRYVRAAAERGDLDQVFEGLTVLGKTGWKINRRVFEVMLQAWNSKEAIANIPPANPDLAIPEKPENGNPDELKAYYREKQRVQNAISGLHSERCFQNFQMEVARTYLNETFYLPHNMDFRGRAYPLPPYFNQMSADNCRGLLLFSKGRELGERGLSWLKIHLANLYGFDKASFQEREQFAMDHLDDIYDSAENGLNGRKWWLKAEDPFQCLAACIELTNALKSPDPTKFVSHLPIHQDGSCNGLQHYAALGGDIIGAQQVNLEPSDRPSDIYTAVAEHVKDSISEDARKGDKIANVLRNKITRKVVKQTVMTNVYGVTFLGAVRQVRRQLRDYYPELETSGIIGVCATYIAQKIFSALGSMFTGAHAIQFWLGDCANRITQSLSFEQLESMLAEYEKLGGIEAGEKRPLRRKKTQPNPLDPKARFNSTVIWTTPLRLPVVQPYRSHKVRRIQTCLQGLSIKDPSINDVADRRKQLQAFPPNFIHSLDATHMLLSAIKCDELGLTFSAVHDSFWTHAGDIDTMNVVLRDAFIRMHSEDIVQRLAAEFKTRFPDRLYLARLRPDSPVAKQIVKFRRANRLGAANGKDSEVVKEYLRIKLLSSSDPAEQEKGRRMVTPASIFAEHPDAEESITSTQSLGVAGMGHVTAEEVKLAASDSIENADDIAEIDSILTPEAGAVDGLESEQSALAAAAEQTRQKDKSRQKTKRPAASVTVWLPLKFRDVPPKGDFDVTRLKQSDYFFS